LERAQEDAREGKSPTTQAGEFVREEIHHVREGKHGVRNAKQAIAIGLSKARKAGIKLPPPPNERSSGKKSPNTVAKSTGTSRKRSRATSNALKRESRAGASATALSKQTKSVAHKRGKASRSAASRKAAQTRKNAQRAA
jgi:hypothetical protein